MAELDYDALGLRCGLEIHQQLETSKLFCRCPSKLREERPHFTIVRRLRPVIGELGEIDIAAAFEQLKGKYFVYEGYHDTTCLVEIDEQPPLPINQEALQIALQIALMLNAKPVDELHIMRKIVIDGSNPSGFQRTVLLAQDGFIEIGGKRISIPTVCLEEDAARIISVEKERIVYRLDRLGIPLIEISTSAEITSPQMCKEAAQKIGLILRSTKVKRGLGTIRQDINVSISKGARVEIKGAQELKLIPKIVELEVKRQLALLEVRSELKKRNISNIQIVKKDVGKLFAQSASKILKGALMRNEKIIAMKVKGFAGLLGKELIPGRRFGTELAEVVQLIGLRGIIHSDELPAYGITSSEIVSLKKLLGCKKDDAFIIIASPEEKIPKAEKLIKARLIQSLKGVPEEVRKANPDGSTSFLRPIPGAARMYPETDLQPIAIKDIIRGIKIPEKIETRILRYAKLGLSKDLATAIAKSERAALFDNLVKRYQNIKPSFIAEILLTCEKTIKKQFGIVIKPPRSEDFDVLFNALNKGKIVKQAVLLILKEAKPVSSVIKKFYVIPESKLKAQLKRIMQQNKGLPLKAIIKKAMEQLKCRAEPKKIIEMLKKLSS